MKSFLKTILYWSFIVYLLYIASILVRIWLSDFKTLVSWFRALYPDAYSIDSYSTTYFTIAHYNSLHHVAPFIILTLALGILYSLAKRRIILSAFDRLLHQVNGLIKLMAASFSDLSLRQIFLVAVCFAILIGSRAYLVITLPYQVDEVFNFVFFVDQGPLHVSIFSNNHVLYNLLTTAWWQMIRDPVIASRMTSLLSAIIINIIIYAVVRKFYDLRAALFVLMITGLTFWSCVFSAQAYAYMLMTACWLVGLISLLMPGVKERPWFELFVTSSGLGFYCSKLFVIPFVCTVVLWIIIAGYRRQGITKEIFLKLLKATIAVLSMTALLYLPMWIWSGTDALLVTNVDHHDLVSKFPILLEIFSLMTDIDSKSYLILASALILFVLLFRRANDVLKILILTNIISLIALLSFVILFRIYPPSRALVFMNLLFYCTIGLAIIGLLHQTSLKPIIVNAGLITLVCIKAYGSLYIANHGWQNMSQGFQDDQFYDTLTSSARCIMKRGPASVYSDQQDNYLNFYLRLVAVEKRTHLTFMPDSSNYSGADVIITDDPLFRSDHHVLIIEPGEFGAVYMKDSLVNSTHEVGEVCAADKHQSSKVKL